MVNTKKTFEKKRAASVSRASQQGRTEEMGRGQVWSVDVLLAVVIFVSVILVFYVTMNANDKKGLSELESDATELKAALRQNSEFGFITQQKLDEEKFKAFVGNATTDYTGVKNKLGLKGDFCIFYEDSEGHVVAINATGNLLPGVGGRDVMIDGYPCGVPIQS